MYSNYDSRDGILYALGGIVYIDIYKNKHLCINVYIYIYI